MLSDALRYPLESDDWLRTILVGGLLMILSVLVLPWFFLQGYYVRVLRRVASGESEPPQFDEWVDLLVDGLKLFALNLLVALAVLAVQIAVAIVMGTGSLVVESSSMMNPASAGGILGALGMLVLLAAMLLIGYVVPAMFVNFAREDSLAAAFDVSTIASGALTREYLVAWGLVVVVSLVLGAAASVLSLLIVGIFGLFYVQVVTYYLFSRGFVAGLEANSSDSAATTL